eukprot:scaffold879_cov410-Prasinococcus_capsulatus_cf.AAC.33
MSSDSDAAISSSTLLCSWKHITASCGDKNEAWFRCKNNDRNPAACLKEGDAVTECVVDT